MAHPLATEGSNIMGEQLRLLVGIPTITGAKIGKYGEVRIQADEGVGGGLEAHGISVHYCLESECGLPPRVREKLLVAVVEGVYPQWLDDTPGSEMPSITFEADSANGNHNAVYLESVARGDAARLLLTTWERGSALEPGEHRETFLTKGQVASLITALLALYPRLHEAGDS